MRVALVLLAVVGCAKSAEKGAAQESTRVGAPGSSAATGVPTGGGEGGNGPAAVGSAAPTTGTTGSLPNAHADEAPKGPPDQQAPLNQSGGGTGVVRGKGSGSGVEAARSGGMLGPSDQRAFVVNGKVSIKKTSLKELDEKVTAKLGAVQACYDKSLEFKDTIAGELTISVKAGTPTVAKSTLKDKELETCVVNVLKTASLPTGKSTLVLAFKRE